MLEDDHLVGNRYLHGKSGYPLTLRWKGCLPFTQDGQLWLGVQYDDPFRGKHDGVYKGRQLFQTTMKGSGALIKASKGVLKSGPTFVQALEERYGPVDPTSEGPGDSVAGKVHLGSSGIVVDLPGIDEVKKRIGRLERLREVGLDGYWVSTLGGDANTLELLRARLKGVHTLNLISNLVKGWKELAEIVNNLDGLHTLMLSNSRIAHLPLDAKERLIAELAGSFDKITELHLCDAGIDTIALKDLVELFSNLDTLRIDDNVLLSSFDHPSFTSTSIRTLSLNGCPISQWSDIVNITSCLPSLVTLDISRVPLDNIPLPESDDDPLPNLANLIMLSSSIARWTDIDGLEKWTRGRLRSFKFTLASAAAETDEEGETLPKDGVDPTRLTGQSRQDRPLLIASLSGLTMLNQTPITATERRDAERLYVDHVEKFATKNERETWGRYAELSKLFHPASDETVNPKPNTRSALKSRMITIGIHLDSDPNQNISMAVLPSTPVHLLRKKICKRLDLGPVELYTCKNDESGINPIAEMTDGQEVGWWVVEGDTVVVKLV